MEKFMDARDYVWKGAIPIQIHLHESEITTLPPPPPFLVLAPRIGYLPLLAPQIKPVFSAALPPGTDTVWFEYKGLPLKWYIPTGVLFDLLCAEPERPWNITVHFRGYPANVLTSCEGEDAIKWSFINSFKEAACIIAGNCKSVMNMSQSDQLDLWRSVLNGSLEVYHRVSSKLKLRAMDDEYITKLDPSLKITRIADDSESPAPSKTGRVPVRLYVRIVNEELDDIEDVGEINSWEEILYVNRPLDIRKGEGGCFSLGHVMKSLLPEYFGKAPEDGIEEIKQVEEDTHHPEDASSMNNENEVGTTACDPLEPVCPTKSKEVKLIRIQGIEPKLDIPFSWVVNNLMNPDYFLHVCVYVKSL